MGTLLDFCIEKVVPLVFNKESKKEEKAIGVITNVDNSSFAPSNTLESQNFPYSKKNSIESICQYSIKCNKISFRKKVNNEGGHISLTEQKESNFTIESGENDSLTQRSSINETVE